VLYVGDILNLIILIWKIQKPIPHNTMAQCLFFPPQNKPLCLSQGVFFKSPGHEISPKKKETLQPNTQIEREKEIHTGTTTRVFLLNFVR
jgi:hypothetical protein